MESVTDSIGLSASPTEDNMTSSDASSHDAVIAEALAVIDQALGTVGGRDLVSSGEVADLLLDLRTALSAAVKV